MRIVLIRPCCIGDVVVATPTLSALRDAYPDDHITWAVGGWSKEAVQYHPAVDAILDTGSAALPVKSVGGFMRFVKQLRTGNFDLAVSLVRSPLMSLAVLLSGIPKRAGLDSNGRGFGYNIRAKIDPTDARHEAEIYLDVMRALGHSTEGYYANLPLLPESLEAIQKRLEAHNIEKPYVVINPAGGSNPGMEMHSKRWLPANFAAVANHLAEKYVTHIILIGAPSDMPIVEHVQKYLANEATVFTGLPFAQIGALAANAMLYIGNDTGITHLAAASGTKTAMILGPSDPVRYAPFTPNSLALWKPTALKHGGVASADTSAWNWERDGISVTEAIPKLEVFLAQ